MGNPRYVNEYCWFPVGNGKTSGNLNIDVNRKIFVVNYGVKLSELIQSRFDTTPYVVVEILQPTT